MNKSNCMRQQRHVIAIQTALIICIKKALKKINHNHVLELFLFSPAGVSISPPIASPSLTCLSYMYFILLYFFLISNVHINNY